MVALHGRVPDRRSDLSLQAIRVIGWQSSYEPAESVYLKFAARGEGVLIASWCCSGLFAARVPKLDGPDDLSLLTERLYMSLRESQFFPEVRAGQVRTTATTSSSVHK